MVQGAPGSAPLRPEDLDRSMYQRRAIAILSAVIVMCAVGLSPALAQANPTDGKPYDVKLMRLAEILGAVHYLRELCGANEGQLWRSRMQELIESEGAAAARRARLTTRFNSGYRSYSRTYQTCTPSAQTAISRFLAEGAKLSDELAATSQ
jgi:uncharacterized protein (TIGR02301 family)